MKKVLLLFFVPLLIAACAQSRPAIVYEDQLELSPAIAQWVQVLCRVEGAYGRRQNEYSLVLVTMGERANGFRVELTGVIPGDDHVLLEVAFLHPERETGARSSTCPYLLFAVKTDKAIRVTVQDGTGPANSIWVCDHDLVELNDLIMILRPLPFEGIADTIRLAGRALTTGPLYATVGDGHITLTEETELGLTPIGGGWSQFDQELQVGRATTNTGTVLIHFGTEDGQVQTIIPIRMLNWGR